jgi:hypothetical protein
MPKGALRGQPVLVRPDKGAAPLTFFFALGMGNVMTKFDPIVVGDKIAAYELEAGKAKGSLLEYSKKSGALLFDVQQNHHEHLEAICARVGISRSRRFELLAIAGGRRTEEENKAISKARQEKKRAKDKAAKAKAIPPPKPVPESVTTNVTDSPEASAERRKAEYVAIAEMRPVEAEPVPVEVHEPQPEAVEPVALPKPKNIPSGRALAEFKVAADHWISKMSKTDSVEAIDYAMAICNRLWGRRAA